MSADPVLFVPPTDLPRQRAATPSPRSAPDADPDPDPGAGPPPQRWIHGASHRRRLEFAFAILRQHGIDARPAPGRLRDGERPGSEERFGAAFPRRGGPHVSWSGADDRTCFTPDGRLQADLPLLVHGVLSPLLATVLAAVGLIGRPEHSTGRYLVLHGIPF